MTVSEEESDVVQEPGVVQESDVVQDNNDPIREEEEYQDLVKKFSNKEDNLVQDQEEENITG